jgi:hypothetical protein
MAPTKATNDMESVLEEGRCPRCSVVLKKLYVYPDFERYLLLCTDC